MKTILGFSIFAACAGWAWVALLHGQAPPPRAQPDKVLTQWVESCLKDFESIKVGMTRGQVEAKLSMDGGLQGISPARFSHPACGYFKIDVEFDFKRNAADQNRAIVDKADKVTKVSKPYIERPFAD
ncbi:MAG TPA: hypothetical protein VJA21_02960 [Verrucomicrobiae bacterium]